MESMVGEVEGVKSRGNELWSGVGALRARKSAMEEKEWAVVDEEGLKQVLEVSLGLFALRICLAKC